MGTFIEIILYFALIVLIIGNIKQRQVGKALEQSETRFRMAFENANICVCLLDLNGNLIRVNKRMCHVFGYDKEEFEGINVNAITHPEDIDIGPHFRMKSLVEDVQDDVFEKRYIDKQGRLIYGRVASSVIRDLNARPLYFISHIRDISEHVRVNKSLQESEARYRALFLGAAEGILAADISTQKFIFANPAICKWLQYSETELIQMGVADIHPHENLPSIVANFEAQARGEISNAYSIPFLCKDGSIIFCDIASNLADFNGKKYNIGFFTDVSARLKAETERRSLEKQLRQSQKMEAIGTLAGGIAHDFNNILWPIIGHAEILLGKLEQNDKTHKNLEQILIAANRAKELVRQILTFSHQNENGFTVFKVQYIIKESMALLSAAMPKTITIRQKIDKTCGLIKGSPTQIQQILMNMGANAYHAMQVHGGILEISLQNIEIGSDFQKINLPAGKYVCLSISDTGCGITPDIMDRIFDPYFTTRARGKGTGLGLSVAKGIACKHGGDISVYSEINQGTIFHIYLPVKKDGLETNLNQDKPIQGGNERILFVDDEAHIVNMAQLILASLGYKVTAVTSSLEALEIFRTAPDNFDLVLTDMTMPIMTGAELSRKILDIRPDFPVILCTGFSEGINKDMLEDIGIRICLNKPINKSKLAETIRNILDNNH